jgi:hypothetical protein
MMSVSAFISPFKEARLWMQVKDILMQGGPNKSRADMVIFIAIKGRPHRYSPILSTVRSFGNMVHRCRNLWKWRAAMCPIVTRKRTHLLHYNIL